MRKADSIKLELLRHTFVRHEAYRYEANRSLDLRSVEKLVPSCAIPPLHFCLPGKRLEEETCSTISWLKAV